jgi:hypothetical protein
MFCCILVCICRVASVFTKTNCRRIHSNTGCWRVIILYHLDGHCAIVRSILSVLLCFLGELVGTRHRERHSNQIVQTYTKFQNEIFWFSTSRATSDSVSIWYWVARIFSQGLFMIISDLMKMVVVLCLCSTWTGSWLGLWSLQCPF